MSSGLPVLVLALLLAHPAAAAPLKPAAPSPEEARLEELYVRLQAALPALQAAVVRVEGRVDSMREEAYWPSLAATRKEQVSSVHEMAEEVRLLHMEFSRMHKKRMAEDTVRNLGRIAEIRRTGGGSEISVEFTRGLHREQVSQDADELLARTGHALAAEMEGWDAMMAAMATREKERQVKRWVRRAAGGTLAGGLLLLAWRLLRARLRERRAAAPALPAGTQAPALPSADPCVIAGAYRIDRELGRGGMGVVFEGEDLSLRRKVAIKRLRDELCTDSEGLEMLLTEARLVATLKHPNVVEVHGVVKEAGRVYLVLELVGGNNLEDSLRGGKRLALASTRGLVRQVAAAIDYAHAHKVIHRDLKPSNIIVDGQGRAKIMDFGIAHMARSTLAHITQAQAAGTPHYMAPEQELGRVSRESDLYALGVCVYRLATGRLPFSGPNFLAQKQGMLFAPPCQAAPDLPKGLDAFMRRALDADPARRFHSGAELAAELDAVG